MEATFEAWLSRFRNWLDSEDYSPKTRHAYVDAGAALCMQALPDVDSAQRRNRQLRLPARACVR